MAGSIKQQQVSNLLRDALDMAFRKNGMYDQSPGMVSIHEVTISPDLLDAKVYLSLFQIEDPAAFWAELEQNSGAIKGDAGQQLRHKLRRIPNIRYLEDETMERAFKIDQILKDLDIPPLADGDEEE